MTDLTEAAPSDLSPQSYDANALAYMATNRLAILDVSSKLGVSAAAIAGTMGREITRADKASFFQKIRHEALSYEARLVPEWIYQSKYKEDLKKLKENNDAFDGNPSKLYALNASIHDLGPGAIKLLTAIKVIDQYKETSQGVSLGLNKYTLNDLRQIARDLDDRNNSLSVKVAGLVILNGQNYFANKSIAGIPWDNLTQEQKDAALTAYYTVGEAAVSADMAKNEFFPFTPGPKGGQVGPWVLFGNHYSKLQAILERGRAHGTSFAPKPGAAGAPKTLLPYKHHAAAGPLSIPIHRMIESLPAYATGGGRRAASIAGPNIASAADNDGRKAGAPVVRLMNPEFYVGMRRHDNLISRLSQARAQLFAAPPSKSGSARGMAGAAANPGGRTPMLGIAGRPSAYTRLPSIAPVRRPAHHQTTAPGNASPYAPFGHTPLKDDKATPTGSSTSRLEPGELRCALEDLLNRQARLPPSGGAGFDPRLTPAWPGLPLPA